MEAEVDLRCVDCLINSQYQILITGEGKSVEWSGCNTERRSTAPNVQLLSSISD
jgi:hypothetical protein